MDELLGKHWSCFDMDCDGSTTPGVSYLKENKSCCVFNERVTFYEHKSLLALELNVTSLNMATPARVTIIRLVIHHMEL